ncbi:uncharacterized protein LOC108681158 [Hyalella azteca]|uniref:Uncharacterized protein LOC108681158 n=1 Tax=Hyalella azteca TaxID=294128 RepID=A0A8B7PI21_HYAAZ|nr:uncharacterized protein LOC108681158 [Hyalella azteca]
MDSFRVSLKEIYKMDSVAIMLQFLDQCWRSKESRAQELTAKNDNDVSVISAAISALGPEASEGYPTKMSWDPLLLWVCPTQDLLDRIAFHVSSIGLEALTSVGSGTGLLEWLLHKSSGLDVTSLEVNRSWWQSKYAPPRFMSHVYVDELQPNDTGEDNEIQPTYAVPSSHALMTCYFNNIQAFRRYLEMYSGPLLLIIGSESSATKTEPSPLQFRDSDAWCLCDTLALGGPSRHDLLAVYKRRPAGAIL